jgi:hypothetical protein
VLKNKAGSIPASTTFLVHHLGAIMGTVSRELAEEIAGNDGRYEDDPRVTKIVEYDTAWGGVAYGLEYDYDNRYTESDFVRNPRIFWEAI